MPADNSEQIAEWNGAMGERWVAMREETNRIVVPFGDAALEAAAPQQGERVIDIGCGCGDTSIELARRVGATGSVLGIDVSRPMTPLSAARTAMGITPPPSDPDAPGPFAFADEQRLRTILSSAGFGAIDVQRFDTAIVLGATPRAAAERVIQIGPVSRLVRES